MAVREILLLGNAKLYEVSREIDRSELAFAGRVVADLHDTMLEFRRKYGFGRAIAAPQIGEQVRIIYMNLDGKACPVVNPRLELQGAASWEVWDDCMSFPGLEVRLRRHPACILRYKDLEWNDCVLELHDDLAELVQHEYDHLDGIVAVGRAIDCRSLRINKAKAGCY